MRRGRRRTTVPARQATARGAVLAGAERQAGIQRQGDAVRGCRAGQMGASDREPMADPLFREGGIGAGEPALRLGGAAFQRRRFAGQDGGDSKGGR